MVVICVFQTPVDGAVPSVPPMITIPSDTAAADRPARASGRAAPVTVVHSPNVPSLASVRLYTVVVGLPSGP